MVFVKIPKIIPQVFNFEYIIFTSSCLQLPELNDNYNFVDKYPFSDVCIEKSSDHIIFTLMRYSGKSTNVRNVAAAGEFFFLNFDYFCVKSI
jgi:hypothetical protein